MLAGWASWHGLFLFGCLRRHRLAKTTRSCSWFDQMVVPYVVRGEVSPEHLTSRCGTATLAHA